MNPFAGKAASPAVKKAAGAAAGFLGPVVAPLVSDVIKPALPDAEQVKAALLRNTATGRLADRVQHMVALTEEMAGRPGLGAEEQARNAEWRARAQRLSDRLANASGGRHDKQLLAAIEADRLALQEEIDAALR